MEINKNMLIADLLKVGNTRAIADELMSIGMHCLGCAMSKGETIEEAAAVHGIDVDDLIARLVIASTK